MAKKSQPSRWRQLVAALVVLIVCLAYIKITTDLHGHYQPVNVQPSAAQLERASELNLRVSKLQEKYRSLSADLFRLQVDYEKQLTPSAISTQQAPQAAAKPQQADIPNSSASRQIQAQAFPKEMNAKPAIVAAPVRDVAPMSGASATAKCQSWKTLYSIDIGGADQSNAPAEVKAGWVRHECDKAICSMSGTDADAATKTSTPLKLQTAPHLHVLAYASHHGDRKTGIAHDDIFCRFLQSTIMNKLNLTLIGWHAPWNGLSTKLLGTYEVLKEVSSGATHG
jgi:hypothetical protein